MCDTVFSSKNFLFKHKEQVHENMTYYKCDICDKLFVALYTLENHVAYVHMKDRPKTFKCSFCNHAFDSLVTLNKHIGNIHKIEKCQICDKLFSQSNDLIIHMKENHNASNTCEFCDITFGQLEDLKRHMKMVHKKK